MVPFILRNEINGKVVISDKTDPWYNLALEEFLLSKVSENEVIFYLWQNENTVVIGKNQNPWKECRYDDLLKSGGKLARRMTGGGAVFHDLGNLNFTFIMDKKLYDLEKQLSVLLAALKENGIDAKFTGRNDITVNERKFSGNAFFHGEVSSLHHGTLLVNSDISKLASYLQVSKKKIESKGVDSVKSRVINLVDVNPNINIEKLKISLIKAFEKVYNFKTQELDISLFKDEFKGIYEKYASSEWRFGETPKFDIAFSKRFDFGEIEFCIGCKEGKITEIKIFSDIMDYSLVEIFEKKLIGTDMESLVYNIKSIEIISEITKEFVKELTIEQKKITDEICEWLITK